MHHTEPAARRYVTRPPVAGRSPLWLMEDAFLALATACDAPMLPAELIREKPERPELPVDQVRTLLAHPATSPELRARTWQEVVRRAQQTGEPWGTVAVAMTVPVLRRMLTRLLRPAHVERAEVEQEALAGVVSALRTVDVEAADVARELFSSADRAVHRLVYAERRRARREVTPTAERLGRLEGSPSLAGQRDLTEAVEDGNEFTVLARAVSQHVISVAEARLIARTRLEGESMQCLAAERGVSTRQLYRHRAAAEQHLAAHLRHLMADA